MRDIRTWICKNKILQQYTDIAANIVPAATAYSEFMITTFLHPKPLRLRMEDMLLDNGMRWAKEIATFLGGSAEEACNWHERRDKVWEDSKAYGTWVMRKDLAFTIPKEFDTVAQITDDPFWRTLLPIFDKYYSAPQGQFDRAEIMADRRALREISDKFQLPLKEAFVSRQSGSFFFDIKHK